MLLWVGFAVMAASVLALVLRPLLRPETARDADSRDATAVYRDQLTEIDAERERGLIGAGEAEAARTEIARRLLASASESEAAAATPLTVNDPPRAVAAARHAALALMAGLPITAMALYLAVGQPGLPSQSAATQPPVPAANADVAQLVAAVEARLQKHPEDGDGWDVIAPVYLRQQRFREAADAFARATRIKGESTTRLAGFAEATVMAHDGIVTETARVAYEKLAKLEPGRIEPRFWLALAKEQDGNHAAAAADYAQLLQGGEPDASWRPLVTERLEAMRAKLGGVAPPATSPGPPANDARGPSAADIASAGQLPAADRDRMIEDMVQGLAARLQKNGDDLAGWQRLIRAYTVMGRKSDAIAALGRARQQFTNAPESLAALAALATSLGLGS